VNYEPEISKNMPISDLASWQPTLQEFINHWTQVNTELGAGGPMILLGPYAVAGLTADRTTLDGYMTAVTVADNSAVAARGDFDVKNALLVARLKQFRGACKAYLPGSSYAKEPPTVPKAGSIAGKFLTAYDDMANLWSQINTTPPSGFTGPLTLAGGYALATFNTDLAALRTSATAYTNGIQNASIAREKRDILMGQLITRLKQYRGAAVAKLPSTSALLNTIPALSPPPGATPQPVTLSGSGTVTGGHLVWTASSNPALSHYAVRYHPGPKYKASEEQAVAIVPAGTTVLDTNFGLAASGSSAWYKVYVVLTTGNERGSNAVKVIRL
jgi:hypothetical protein